MTTETEDLLWIAAQQDKIIPRELVIYASESNRSLYDLIMMEESDLKILNQEVVKKFLAHRDRIPLQTYQEIYELMQKELIRMIKYNDPLFPPKLKKLRDNIPIMLYHQGNEMEFTNCIAIVGTRNCSTYGAEIARGISRALVEEGYTIVTGLARGIDAAAHRGALSVGGKVVGVLPWIYKPYPPEHERLMQETKKAGCIISEYWYQTKQFDRYKFLERNAVISGMSDVLIAVESSYSGGTRWQVELALSQGRTVVAIEPEKSNELAYEGYKTFVLKGATKASNFSEVLEIVRKKAPVSKDSRITDFADHL